MPVLFNGTVEQNIRYGSLEQGATREAIIEAATLAQAHDFITQMLEHGYETQVSITQHRSRVCAAKGSPR